VWLQSAILASVRAEGANATLGRFKIFFELARHGVPEHDPAGSTANYLPRGGPACAADLRLQRLGRRGELYSLGEQLIKLRF
jgi:hypothetical protein